MCVHTQKLLVSRRFQAVLSSESLGGCQYLLAAVKGVGWGGMTVRIILLGSRRA